MVVTCGIHWGFVVPCELCAAVHADLREEIALDRERLLRNGRARAALAGAKASARMRRIQFGASAPSVWRGRER